MAAVIVPITATATRATTTTKITFTALLLWDVGLGEELDAVTAGAAAPGVGLPHFGQTFAAASILDPQELQKGIQYLESWQKS
jgi:hypothetical protein